MPTAAWSRAARSRRATSAPPTSSRHMPRPLCRCCSAPERRRSSATTSKSSIPETLCVARRHFTGERMPALVCGSLAFDSIATFPGRFADQILANQLHVLNVSFLVPTLRREFGGCAGNIAYNLAALGGQPVVLAAVGSDGYEYLARLRSWGTTIEHVRPVADSLTAQAFIITDLDNNQITAFHPGAMQAAHETPVPARSDLRLAIIAPDGRSAMLEHAAQLAAARIP